MFRATVVIDNMLSMEKAIGRSIDPRGLVKRARDRDRRTGSKRKVYVRTFNRSLLRPKSRMLGLHSAPKNVEMRWEWTTTSVPRTNSRRFFPKGFVATAPRKV